MSSNTTHGQVRGARRTTVYDDSYYCFDGIPYAKPPLAELRFKSPQEMEPWQGVRDCTEIALKSLQYNGYQHMIEGSEDCLYLNVYAKKLQSEKPLPVMVYIHGGGFNTGDASRLSWGPDYFMMKDVILISIGYRLGALGFLRLADPELQIPGNAGLKDQIMALRWIQSNVLQFNGNPDNITLFGHSAGGCSTHFLMLTEQCRGLFDKAILMSGFCHNGLFHRDINLEYRLACSIGYMGENNDKEIYEFLLQVESNKLVGCNFWIPQEIDKGLKYGFAAGIEYYETADAVITREPVEMLRNAWSNEIPIILGATSFEGLINYKRFTMQPSLYERLHKHPEYLLPRELQLKCEPKLQKHLSKDLLNIHFKGKELNITNAYCAMDLESYTLAYHPIHRTICSRRSYSKALTFLYRFDFDSPTFNLYRIKHCGPDVRGVVHVDELSYIFYMPTSYKLSKSSSEFKTILRMIDMWIAFAERSDPNTSIIEPAYWRPIDKVGKRKCLNISENIEFVDSPEEGTCNRWDELYESAGLELY